ncbi:hypothetical protein BE21_58765 [Sorangium cellulosum]|uniref:Uncharacterized protein n=1 Tax=Sorangium cellulosum TaxID=56 RepID=A0A150U1V0_SORCE|nr:hypothetical protein BE21_58765 [Sorangium cellulosum]
MDEGARRIEPEAVDPRMGDGLVALHGGHDLDAGADAGEQRRPADGRLGFVDVCESDNERRRGLITPLAKAFPSDIAKDRSHGAPCEVALEPGSEEEDEVALQARVRPDGHEVSLRGTRAPAGAKEVSRDLRVATCPWPVEEGIGTVRVLSSPAVDGGQRGLLRTRERAAQGLAPEGMDGSLDGRRRRANSLHDAAFTSR